jgi:hypothetical protein
MTISRILVASLVLGALAPQATAGFFSRKPKVNPTDRVPELLTQLKASTDEGQRTTAAEELRDFDGKNYPEIVAGLIDALGRDTSPAVRTEAATSLGKVRPISQQAGYALEQALNNDASMRVRMAARQALWSYHITGYRTTKPPEPASDAATRPNQANGRTGNARLTGRESPEPPLAVSPSAPALPRPQTVVPIAPNPMREDMRPAAPSPSAPRGTAVETDGPALPPA